MTSKSNYEISREWYLKKKDKWNEKGVFFTKYPTSKQFELYAIKQIQKGIDIKIKGTFMVMYHSINSLNIFYKSTNPDYLITVFLYRAVNQFKDIVDLIRFESVLISKIVIDNEDGDILSKDIWLEKMINRSAILDYSKYSQGSYFRFPKKEEFTLPRHSLEQDIESDWYYNNLNIEGKKEYQNGNTSDPWYSVKLPFNTEIISNLQFMDNIKFMSNGNNSTKMLQDYMSNLKFKIRYG